ncbi:MAG TPA: dephospho-CoA kinase [Terriglobales bacterium]|nr:dephospho-CoA kinase [Terriglobales bacterium]
MTLRVGLTGGLASGKTTVAEMFAARGAHVMYADKIGHELMQPGEPVHDEVVRHFGKAIVNSDQSINRSALAEIAFGTGRIEELNQIVHPAVVGRLEQWIDEMTEFDPRAILIFEAALILEAGLGKHFNKLVVVTSEPQQKLERFAVRTLRGMQDDVQRSQALREAERRIGIQLSDAEKIAAADYVIDNSGTVTGTERQVNKIYKELQQLAAGRRPESLS